MLPASTAPPAHPCHQHTHKRLPDGPRSTTACPRRQQSCSGTCSRRRTGLAVLRRRCCGRRTKVGMCLECQCMPAPTPSGCNVAQITPHTPHPLGRRLHASLAPDRAALPAVPAAPGRREAGSGGVGGPGGPGGRPPRQAGTGGAGAARHPGVRRHCLPHTLPGGDQQRQGEALWGGRGRQPQGFRQHGPAI